MEVHIQSPRFCIVKKFSGNADAAVPYTIILSSVVLMNIYIILILFSGLFLFPPLFNSLPLILLSLLHTSAAGLLNNWNPKGYKYVFFFQ